MAELNFKLDFLKYGSTLKDGTVVDHNGIFGNFTSYTMRQSATQPNKEDKISFKTEMRKERNFINYTSREIATENSSHEKKYFTMSDIGKIYNEDDLKKWKDKHKHTFNKEGDILYRLIISFETEDLKKDYGLNGQEDLSKIVNESMFEIFEKLGFNPKNMCWWEDSHTNTDNMHMHISFCEMNKTRQNFKNYDGLTRTELKNIKSVFTKNLISKNRFLNQKGYDYKTALKKSDNKKKDIAKIIHNSDEFKFETMQDIFNLYIKLPKTGRLQYNSSFMKPFRKELDMIVDEILNDPKMRTYYQDYLNDLKELVKCHNDIVNSDITNLVTNEDKKLRILIANGILNDYKEVSNKIDFQNLNQSKRNHLLNTLKNETRNDRLNKILNATNTEDIKETLNLLIKMDNSTERDLMIAKTLLEIGTDEDYLKAINIINDLNEELNNEDNNKQCIEHTYNTFNKSLSLNKNTYNYLNNNVGHIIKGNVLSTINREQNRIENEISAFLNNSKELTLSDYSDVLLHNIILNK